MRTLFIVDGDSSGGSLRRALPKSEILVWRDALYEGPVPARRSPAQLNRIRAGYWGAPPADFSRRDRALARANRFDEIVLWFGPTMVCQLSLAQLLHHFSAHPAKNLTLIDHEYAGWLPPEKIAPHLARRRKITPAMLRTGRAAWKAFTASNPAALKKFLAADSSTLPELLPILQKVVQEYPDASGLSRIERKVLAQFRRPQKAVVGVANALRDETFGDTYYFGALDDFLGATNQLLCFAEPPPENLRAAILVATEFGRKVLAGKADAIAFNGIDRWIGGVHLEGFHPVRRDYFSLR